MFLFSLLNDALNISLARNVGFDSHAADLLGGRFSILDVDIYRDDFESSFCREPLGHGFPDTTGGARYNNNPILDFHS